jgi:hypothetical protein
MSRQIYDDVELSLDEINDGIDYCDEEYDRTDDLTKRISIVADMKNVLKLEDDDDDDDDDDNDDNDDDDDDENQQSWRQSIEKEVDKQQHKNQQSRPFLSPHSHEYPCKDACKKLPQPPEHWPQKPLMIRPSPLSSTTVIGIVSHDRIPFILFVFHFFIDYYVLNIIGAYIYCLSV